jgi:hypothetical protein
MSRPPELDTTNSIVSHLHSYFALAEPVLTVDKVLGAAFVAMVFAGTTTPTDGCHRGHRPAGELIERWRQDDADLTGREAFDDDESPAAKSLRRVNAGIARAIDAGKGPLT